jgi:hypothetical protein
MHYRFQEQGLPTKEHTTPPMYKSTDTITISPDKPGTYTFVSSFWLGQSGTVLIALDFQEPHSISDANYQAISIPKFLFKQTIHPKAEFHLDIDRSRGSKRRIIRTCQTNTTEIDLYLKGTVPFTVEYDLIWPDQVLPANNKVTFDSGGKHKLMITVPETLARDGGHFSVSLTRVWDGHGCSLSIPDHNLSYEARTVRVSSTWY